jgi:hypothetical protein
MAGLLHSRTLLKLSWASRNRARRLSLQQTRCWTAARPMVRPPLRERLSMSLAALKLHSPSFATGVALTRGLADPSHRRGATLGSLPPSRRDRPSGGQGRRSQARRLRTTCLAGPASRARGRHVVGTGGSSSGARLSWIAYLMRLAGPSTCCLVR